MKRNQTEPTSAWVVDYSAARAEAIRWLGDRYLLAKPINRKRDASRTLPAAHERSPAPQGDDRC